MFQHQKILYIKRMPLDWDRSRIWCSVIALFSSIRMLRDLSHVMEFMIVGVVQRPLRPKNYPTMWMRCGTAQTKDMRDCLLRRPYRVVRSRRHRPLNSSFFDCTKFYFCNRKGCLYFSNTIISRTKFTTW